MPLALKSEKKHCMDLHWNFSKPHRQYCNKVFKEEVKKRHKETLDEMTWNHRNKIEKKSAMQVTMRHIRLKERGRNK